MRILSNLSVSGLLGLNSVADANTDTDKFLVLDSSGIVRYRTGAEVFSDIGAGGAAAYTSVLQHTVKAGETLTKGQAVYVTSADGTNMIVGKASNATEATSSKTLGLIAQNLATNDQGFVITEGLLAGLDTSTANAGDPVWLGTGGNLLFGLANKPYAPTHMVFIGIVTRAQQNNGEIFVKVQNGFELQELHNVQITSTPSDNTVLSYETSTSLYKMKSIPTLLGYTPVTNARNITINGTTYDLSADRTWSVGTHTGSLTTGYIPKATGTTTLTDGLMYDTGSAVLIGTQTAGSGKFMVYSASPDNHYQAIGSAPSFRFADTITSPNYTGIFGLATATNHFIIGAAAGDMVLSNNTTSSIGNFLFGTGATERMRINASTGNISINSTNNTYRFDVTGTVRFTGQLRLESTITNGTHTYTLPSATGTLALTSDIPSLSGYVPTSRTITINGVTYDLSADRSWTVAGGLSGSGTTNYLPKFTGTSSIGDSIITDNGYYAGFNFTGSGSLGGQNFGVDSVGAFQNNLGSYGYRWLINGGGTEIMRLNASGNLSIGNTNDTYKLDVSGTGRFTSNLYTSTALYINTTAAYGFRINSEGNNGFYNRGGSTAAHYPFLLENSSGALLFQVQGTGVATFGSSGGSGLRVYGGSGTNQWDVYLNSTNLRFSDNTGTGSVVFDRPISGTSANFSGTVLTTDGFQGRYFRIFEASAQRGGFYTYNVISGAGTDYSVGLFSESTLWFAAGGGITKHLQIASTGAATFSSSVTANGLYANAGNSARFYRSANDYYWSIHNDSNNFLNFGTFAANGTAYGTNPKMILLDNGNVGIGTTSPTERFEVNGSIKATGRTVSGTSVAGITISYESGIGYIESWQSSPILTRAYNYIAWDTFGSERMRITSGGNVGIGTTSPGARLTVQGSDNSYGSGIRWQHTSSGNYIEAIHGSSDTLYWGYNGSTFLQMANTSSFNILTTNVGIGTTSPSSNLHVSYGTGASAVVRIESNGAGQNSSIAYYSGGFYRWEAGTGISATTSYEIFDRVNTVSRFRIAPGGDIVMPSGNVGIGTTSPSYKLHVAGTSVGFINPNSPSDLSATQTLVMGGVNGNNAYLQAVPMDWYAQNYSLEIGTVASSSAQKTHMRFVTEGSERMRITSGGNVGIGTTSPNVTGFGGATALTIQASIQPVLELIGSTYNAGGVFGGGVVQFRNSSTAVATLGVENLTGNQGNMVFYTNDGSTNTERMRITGGSGTDVLIGTTSNPYTASGRACVLLNGSVNSLYGWSVGGSAKGYMYHTGTDVYLENSVSGGFFSITQVGAGYISLTTNGSERMRITSGGNVGIGTTSPASVGSYKVLDIQGSSGAMLYLSSNGSDGGRVYGNSGGLSYDAFASGHTWYTPGGERMRITGGGNVGIGTSLPVNKFAVVTRNNFAYYNRTEAIAVFQGPQPTVLIANDGNSGGEYSELKLGNNQTDYYSYSAFVRGVQGSGINVYELQFGTANFSPASTKMTLTADGNLLLNTTTNSGYRLNVNGSGYFNSTLYVNNTITATKGYFSSNGATDSTTAILGNASTNDSTSYAAIFGSLNAGYRMVVRADGNVGIGTTSPQTELHVKASSGWAEIRIDGASGSAASLEYYSNGMKLGDLYCDTSANMIFRNNTSNERMRITNVGDVLVNATMTTQSAKFYVNGKGAFGSLYIANLSTGTVYSNMGNLTNTNPSDIRLKNTIKPLTYGLNEVLQLNPKTFYYNDDATRARLKYGFIAQEVKEVMPDMVRLLGNEDYLGLESEGIWVTLVNAIKEQQAQIEELKSQLNK